MLLFFTERFGPLLAAAKSFQLPTGRALTVRAEPATSPVRRWSSHRTRCTGTTTDALTSHACAGVSLLFPYRPWGSRSSLPCPWPWSCWWPVLAMAGPVVRRSRYAVMCVWTSAEGGCGQLDRAAPGGPHIEDADQSCMCCFTTLLDTGRAAQLHRLRRGGPACGLWGLRLEPSSRGSATGGRQRPGRWGGEQEARPNV